MPRKSQPTMVKHGKVVPNPAFVPVDTTKPNPPANRLAYAVAMLLEKSYSATRDSIVRQFGVHKATAERDIRDAQLQIQAACKAELPYLLSRETVRLTRIADKSEDAAKFHEAIAASREIGKMNGIYAPKKIQMSGSIGVSVEIRAVMSILDAKGLAALDTVLEQVEAAKAKGLLRPPVVVEDDADEPE